MTPLATRNHIIQSADQLFYRQGFDHTSFADIAADVNISRGNFYYHFKSKDEILDAVIQVRLATTKAMLDQWECESPAPTARIVTFIEMLIRNQTDIMAYGCPVGTLCNELAKLNHVSKSDAAKLFTLFHRWLEKQFNACGHGAQSGALAMHLLAMSQGVATLANTFRDEAFVLNEVERMRLWLSTLKQTATD